jgi:hypothetical protein
MHDMDSLLPLTARGGVSSLLRRFGLPSAVQEIASFLLAMAGRRLDANRSASKQSKAGASAGRRLQQRVDGP